MAHAFDEGLGDRLTAPLVMGYRLTQMICGGWPPSASAQGEYALMSEEKIAAFCDTWVAVAGGWPLTSPTALDRALTPVHAKVMANNRRLAGRSTSGPR